MNETLIPAEVNHLRESKHLRVRLYITYDIAQRPDYKFCLLWYAHYAKQYIAMLRDSK